MFKHPFSHTWSVFDPVLSSKWLVEIRRSSDPTFRAEGLLGGTVNHFGSQSGLPPSVYVSSTQKNQYIYKKKAFLFVRTSDYCCDERWQRPTPISTVARIFLLTSTDNIANCPCSKPIKPSFWGKKKRTGGEGDIYKLLNQYNRQTYNIQLLLYHLPRWQ